MKIGMPKIAFGESAERVMVEATECAESKASADDCMVRTFDIAVGASRVVVRGDTTYLLLRSNKKRLEPDRTLCQAANGRTTSSTRMTSRESWSLEASALLERSQETKSGRPDPLSCPWLEYWA